MALSALGFVVSAALVSAASVSKQLDALYAPFRVQQAAVAPDGRHVAFTVFNGHGLEVQIFDLDQPGPSLRTPLDERPAAETNLLAWASPERVVAVSDALTVAAIDVPSGATQRFNEGNPAGRGARGPARNGARGPARGGARPGPAGRTARVLGLAPDDPDTLLMEATTPTPPEEESIFADPETENDVTTEVYRLNLRTGAHQQIFERPLHSPGGSVILDRTGTPRLLLKRGALPQRFDYRPPGTESPDWKNADQARASLTIGAKGADKQNWKDLDLVLTDRTNFAFTVKPENFAGARTIPLGFGSDPNLLFYASNLGRDTFAIYAADLRTGQRATGAVQDPTLDLADFDAPWAHSPLIFDRKRGSLAGVRSRGLEPATHWLDPSIASAQTALADKFPGRNVQILDWDDAHDRFAALVSSPGNPGRYFVFCRSANLCTEFFRRAPSVEAADANRTEPFTFVTASGVTLSGVLTWPHVQRVATPPLVIWLRDATAQRKLPDFDRDAQALAAMGFVVAQLNYGGLPGFGRAQRENLHRNLDHGPVSDVVATIDWLAAHQPLDGKHVAVVGEGFGGYLALRALQLKADAFRCAVALDAPVDLADLQPRKPFQAARGRRGGRGGGGGGGGAGDGGDGGDGGASDGLGAEAPPPSDAFSSSGFDAADSSGTAVAAGLDFEGEFLRWFISGPSKLGELAVTKHPELLTKPVFLLHHPDNRRAPVAAVRALRDQLTRRKLPPTYFELRPQDATGALNSREIALRKIGEFLNANLYDYGVKLGELSEKD